MADGVDVDAIRREVILDRERAAARVRAEDRFFRALPWLIGCGAVGVVVAAAGWPPGVIALLLAGAVAAVLLLAGTEPGVSEAERVEAAVLAVACPQCRAGVGWRCIGSASLLSICHPERVGRYRDVRLRIEAEDQA